MRLSLLWACFVDKFFSFYDIYIRPAINNGVANGEFLPIVSYLDILLDANQSELPHWRLCCVVLDTCIEMEVVMDKIHIEVLEDQDAGELNRFTKQAHLTLGQISMRTSREPIPEAMPAPFLEELKIQTRWEAGNDSHLQLCALVSWNSCGMVFFVLFCLRRKWFFSLCVFLNGFYFSISK